jgi:MFS family permease
MRPTDRLWIRYLKRVEELRERGTITVDEFNLLRFSAEARRGLVEATRGDASAFAEGTVDQVLASARAEARAETERRLETETAQRVAAEAATSAVVAAHAREETERLERLRGIASSVSKWAFGVAAVVLGGLAIAGILAGTSLAPTGDRWKWLVGAVGAIGIAMALVGAIFGSSVKSLAESIRQWCAVLVLRLLRRLAFGRPPDPANAASAVPGRRPSSGGNAE